MKLVHLVIGLAIIVASAIQTSAARPRIPHRHLQEEADAADDVTFDEYSTVEEEGWEEPEEPQCGLLDEECCLDGGSPCLIGGTGCDIMGDMRCTVFCGGEGQPCCLGDICYSPSRGKAGKSGKNKSNEKRMRRFLSSGNSDSSTSSSGKNKSKSKSKSMSKGGDGRCKCICEPGLRFDYSTKTCEKCGKPDLPCCETEDGPVCNAGSTCLAATQVCKSCGNHAQPECSGDDNPCLAGNTPAYDGTCTKCGLEVDDPCCPVPDDSSKDGCEEDLQCGARGLCTEGSPPVSRSALESTEDFNPNLLKDDAVLQTQKAAECAFVANGNTYNICDLKPCSDNSYLVQDTVDNTMRINKPKLRTCSKGDVNDAMIVVNRNEQGVIISIEVMGGNENLLLVAIDSVNKPNCLATIRLSDYSTETLSKFSLAPPKREASNDPQGRKVKEETRPEDLRSKMLGRTPNNRRLQVVCTEFKEIELAVIYDHLFCQDAGGTALAAEAKIEYLVTLTSARYQQVCTNIRLVYVSGYCDKAMDPFDRTNDTDLDNFGRYDVGQLLDEFRAHWQSKDAEVGVERVNRDLAHLLTGQPLGPTAVVDGQDVSHPLGRAWLGVLCNFNYPYGVDNAVELGSSHLAATIIVHEIGHNVGAEHLDTNRDVYDYNACYQAAEPRKTLVATCSDLNDNSFNYDECQGFGTSFFDFCKETCETRLTIFCTQSVEDYQCDIVFADDAKTDPQSISTGIRPSCHIMYPTVAAGLSTFIQSSVDVLRMEIDNCGSVTTSTVACPTGYFKLYTLYSIVRDVGERLFCVEVEAYNSGRCEISCIGTSACACGGSQTEVEQCCQQFEPRICEGCPDFTGFPPGPGLCDANDECPTVVVSV